MFVMYILNKNEKPFGSRQKLQRFLSPFVIYFLCGTAKFKKDTNIYLNR